MAGIDVSWVLLDPDFADVLTCIRNTQVVGANGRATATSVSTQYLGVVTNDTGDMIKRAFDGERMHGNIVVHSCFPLTAGGGSNTADEIAFRGKLYVVSAVSDYSHFGSGFTAAVCDLKPITG